MKSLKNTTSCFILYIALKEKTLPYKNHNIYHFDSDNVWGSNEYNKEDWGKDYAVFYSKSVKNPDYCESMTIIAYMDIQEVEAWKRHIQYPSRRKV